MGTDSLKLEFIQDFLAADLDESFITRLKKELKDFCSSKKQEFIHCKHGRVWVFMNVRHSTKLPKKQVQQGQTRSNDEVKKMV